MAHIWRCVGCMGRSNQKPEMVDQRNEPTRLWTKNWMERPRYARSRQRRHEHWRVHLSLLIMVCFKSSSHFRKWPAISFIWKWRVLYYHKQRSNRCWSRSTWNVGILHSKLLRFHHSSNLVRSFIWRRLCHSSYQFCRLTQVRYQSLLERLVSRETSS